MDDYSSLEQGYPDPLATRRSAHPREQYDRPIAERAPQYKVLDFDEYNSPPKRVQEDIRRDKIPSFHTMPNPDNSHYVQPYSHAMKRTGNAERMREIFGGQNQDFSGMDNVQFATPQPRSVERFSQPSQPQVPQGYVPRMKYMDPSEDPSRNSSQVIDNNSAPRVENPSRIQIYNAIIDYFPGFIMCKTAIHGNMSVYKGFIQCLLCDGSRYIVAIVPGDTSPIGSKKPLYTLAWIAFQTRFVENDKDQQEFGISAHQYSRPDKTILNDVIRLSRKTQAAMLYTCDNLPLQVEILKVKEDEDINETGTVAGALELFQSVISFTD